MARYGSRASNISGLLGSIGDTIGEMGKPGEQYIDTFRRSMAPEADMNDSASLLSYADWARRNGYEDEATNYLALGYKRKAVEGEKAYKTSVAQGENKLRGFNQSIGELEAALTKAMEADPDSAMIANTEMAIEKVKDARLQHINGMNDYGAGNDYGIGDEGTKSSLKLQAEVVAAEKADMERRELQLSIQQSEMELADAIVEGAPIPLSSLPPALRESYEKGLRMAKEGPMPAAALRDLNEKYSPRSIDYLTSLGEGDEATQQLLWSSTRDIRKNVDEDVGEWMADPDNQEAIAKAVETAESQLLGDSKYRTASPENREIMAQDALVKVLRGMRADLDKLYEDAEKDADRDSAAATAQAKKVNEDRAMKYDAGMEPGGEQYNRARANAEKAKGESFDPEAFDASWDRRFFNPWGATELPAPIY